MEEKWQHLLHWLTHNLRKEKNQNLLKQVINRLRYQKQAAAKQHISHRQAEPPGEKETMSKCHGMMLTANNLGVTFTNSQYVQLRAK